MSAREAFGALRARHASVRACDLQAHAAGEIWATLGGLGFHGFLISPQHGGTARGMLAAVVVMEELAAHGLHSFLPILEAMGVAALTRFGTEQAKRRILSSIASGKEKLGIASTEREAGFNVLNITTRAERRGDDYLLNGEKVYVSGADLADHLVTVTRTRSPSACVERGLPKTAGMSVFLVPAQAEGIKREPLPSRGEGLLTQFALRLEDG